MSTTTCLGCGAKLVGALCSDCEHKAAQIIQQSHWPLETSLSPHALAHVEAAIELYMDNDRTQGVEPRAVEIELTNLASNIRAHLQHVVYAHGREGVTWWNALTDEERVYWMDAAGNTGVAADAWEAFKRAPKVGDRPYAGKTFKGTYDMTSGKLTQGGLVDSEPTDEDLLR